MASPQFSTSPDNGDTGISLSTNMIVDITDTDGDLDASTVEIRINDIPAWSSEAEQTGFSVSVSAIANGYRYTIDPDENLFYNSYNEIYAYAFDLSSNFGSTNAYFTTIDGYSPKLTNSSPTHLEIGVSSSSSIVLDITDGYDDLDIDTVEITVNGSTAWSGDSAQTGFSGSKTSIANGYRYTITPSGNLSIVNTVIVYAEDTLGGFLDTNFSFSTSNSPPVKHVYYSIFGDNTTEYFTKTEPDSTTKVTQIDFTIAPYLFDIHGTSDHDIWMVGNNGIFHYNGYTIRKHPTPTNGNWRSVHAVSPSEVYVTGSQKVLKYNGEYWEQTYTVPFPGFHALWHDGTYLYGLYSASGSHFLERSSDGGVTWDVDNTYSDVDGGGSITGIDGSNMFITRGDAFDGDWMVLRGSWQNWEIDAYASFAGDYEESGPRGIWANPDTSEVYRARWAGWGSQAPTIERRSAGGVWSTAITSAFTTHYQYCIAGPSNSIDSTERKVLSPDNFTSEYYLYGNPTDGFVEDSVPWPPGMGDYSILSFQSFDITNVDPELDNSTPSDGETDVKVNTSIVLDIIDDDDDLDASTVIITVAGSTAWSGDSAQTGFSGSKTAITNGYRYTISPDTSFDISTTITVGIYAEDSLGGTLNTTISFTTADSGIVDVEIEEGYGSGYNTAYSNGSFVTPYSGTMSISKVDAYDAYDFSIQKSSELTEGRITVRVVGYDGYDDPTDLYPASMATGQSRNTSISFRIKSYSPEVEIFSVSTDYLNSPVDFITAVDNSTSMYLDLDTIGYVNDNIHLLHNLFINDSIDYHFVMVSMKGTSFPWQICVQSPMSSGGCADSSTFIHINTPVGSAHCLYALANNFSSYSYFLRSNAIKEFMAVSDGDSGFMTWTDFEDSINGDGIEDFLFHGVVGLDASDTCADAIGTEYIQGATETQGEQIHVCTTDWPNDVITVLYEATKTELRRSYELTGTPVESSIYVYTGPSSTGPWTKQNGNWSYVASSNVIKFDRGSTPSSSYYVKVEYASSS